MKPFKQMPKSTFHLPLEMAIYVPSKTGTKAVTPAIHRKRAIDVKTWLSNKFGGYTSMKTEGGFTDKKGRLINEKVIVVTSFSTRGDWEKGRKELKQYLKKLKVKYKQESIGFQFEGDLYYV